MVMPRNHTDLHECFRFGIFAGFFSLPCRSSLAGRSHRRPVLSPRRQFEYDVSPVFPGRLEWCVQGDLEKLDS